MIRKLMSAAMVIGLTQVGCASIETTPADANNNTAVAVKHECQKGKKGQCDKKSGAKHECKKGKKAQCDKKAGAKHEGKKAQSAVTK